MGHPEIADAGEGGPPAEVLARLERARLLALDVDGTLTEGRVVYLEGQEVQSFCVQDGLGLSLLKQAGVPSVWITGRGSNATERRAAELGVQELHLRAGPKALVLAGIQERLDVSPEETVAMGDDLPDLDLALRAAVFVAPANACAEVGTRADWVTRAPGGAGAVRELAEAILRAKGLWDGVLDRYGRSSD